MTRDELQAAGLAKPCVVVLSLPPRCLLPNSKVHWGTKKRARKRSRCAAYCYALAVRPPKPWAKARETSRFYFRDRRWWPDPDGCLGWLKSAFDGIADAGVVGNDKNLSHREVERYVDRENPRVEITIEEA
jgi:hypothetical protein